MGGTQTIKDFLHSDIHRKVLSVILALFSNCQTRCCYCTTLQHLSIFAHPRVRPLTDNVISSSNTELLTRWGWSAPCFWCRLFAFETVQVWIGLDYTKKSCCISNQPGSCHGYKMARPFMEFRGRAKESRDYFDIMMQSA